MSKLPSMLLVVALFSVGCASTGKAVAKLEPGMTTQQILAVLGRPADRSFRGSDEAWQYQEIAGFGQCKYITVWISNGKLVGVSTRRGASERTELLQTSRRSSAGRGSTMCRLNFSSDSSRPAATPTS